MAEDQAKVEFTKGSWLKNVKYNELDNGSITWTQFLPPKLDEERPGDVEFTINRSLRPEQIADRFYGNQRLWWVIAYANKIQKPLVGFAIGQTIRIPSPEFVLNEIETEEMVGRNEQS